MDNDFAELSHDTDLISRMRQFRTAALRIEDIVSNVADPAVYEKLDNADKIKYDLLMSYTINSLFWMYLRAEGIDPTKHQIKSENERVKQSMQRAKQINDKKTLMPRLDIGVAKRFIRSACHNGKDGRKRQRVDDK